MGRIKLDLQKRNAVVHVGSNFCGPSGALESVGIAPGVVVEGEEVASHGGITAVHVSSGLVTVLGHIGCGVTDRDGPVASGGNVLLHVASNSLDVGSAVCVSGVVDDFISGEEEEGVAVTGKRINRREDTLEVDVVIRRLWVCAVDGVF